MKPRWIFAIGALVLLVGAMPSHAQWSTDPTVNNAICTATSNKSWPTIVSDGAGGAIITWMDGRSSNQDIYAQRINASGVVQWTADGVAICTATNDQESPTIVSDGAGGAIITWHDLRSGNSDIYAQRINASGVVQWTADGVAICTATNYQLKPTIASDGAGGAIITWDDDRSGSDYPAIYVQRINASGVVQWTADGVAICTATSYQVSPTIVSDGAGGAIITWNDFRSGGDYSHIYAQRINASGVVQWTADGVATGGVAIGPEPKEESRPTIVGDGAGGAIITWRDQRSGIYSDIYAQRINASGVVQWTADGVAIGTATNDQESPNIASDDAGGAIITWQDYRSGSGDIYAQRVRSDGTLGGNSAITAQEAVQNLIDQVEALNKPQGYGLIRNLKVVIARLDDNRIDKAIEMLQQFIDQVEIFIGNGTLKENEGQPLINAANAIIGALSNSSQAAKRNGASEGLTAVALPTEFQLEQNSPNPFNPVTTIQFSVPRESFVRLKVYNSFGAEVATLVDRQVAAGTYKVNWDASRLASGFYLYRLEAEGFAQTKKLLLMK